MRGVVATFCVLVSTLAFAGPTSAQPLAPGQIGLFVDEAGTSSFLPYDPSQPVDIYVFANVPIGGLGAWEARINLDPEIFLVGIELDSATSINIGTTPEFIVGLGDGCRPFPGMYRLAKLTLFIPDGGSRFLCLEPLNDSSVTPPAPAYANCQNQVLALPAGNCVVLDSFCSPGNAWTIVGFPGAEAAPNTRVEVPLSGFAFTRFGCTIPQLTRLTFDLDWDETVVVLDDIVLDDLPADWTGSISPIPSGGTRLELSGTTPVQIDNTVFMATLGFRFGPDPGSTQVTPLGAFASGLPNDAEYTAVFSQCCDLPYPTFISMPVAVESTSMGAVRARF